MSDLELALTFLFTFSTLTLSILWYLDRRDLTETIEDCVRDINWYATANRGLQEELQAYRDLSFDDGDQFDFYHWSQDQEL